MTAIEISRPAAVDMAPQAGSAITIVVYGTPAGQGQISFRGRGRGAYHTNGDRLLPWRRSIVDAALQTTGRHEFTAWRADRCACDVPKKQHALFVGVPVHAEITITVEKPKSAPKRVRTWPITRSSTDIDHHARACLDALSAAGVFVDDSQVVRLAIGKGYPGEDADALEQPGAVIRVRQIGGVS